ncbi:MAG: serine/threonine protein kinase [Nannocystis sp.]|uniref:serine/threonine-protein kinase n=1 Tax=Nannocystis sp. TaxID=1962667 RepID=UPI002426E3B3|nr:serine/threonine-protein kinase [Nannocystis sp.]MBK9756439.1 serine/threonine protein kinase [Nannocystis sp.]
MTRSTAPAAVARPELAMGTVIGRYLVLERLGAGAMGVVYSAFDPELDRKVAIKLLQPDTGGNQASMSRDARARLVREAQALARLSHPGVVAIHDVGVHGDEVWIAMELVHGRVLRTWLSERRRSWREVLTVMIAAGRGLAAAHAAGLIHRDVKPDNVMIDDEGRVRVMDFGLARRGASDDPSRPALASDGAMLAIDVTTAGSLIGTPAYMAPEQFQGEGVGPAADIFAFCVMLWEGLHGARPFAGKTLAELRDNVLAGRIVAPHGPAAPRWLRAVLIRGLAVDPGKRWASMAALLAELDRGQARVQRRRWLGAGVGVVVLAAGLLGAREAATRSTISTCEAMGAAVFDDWSATTRADIERAFMATGKTHAATVFAKTTPWLDGWASAWQTATTRACLHHRVDATWDDELHARASDCLAEERGRFTSLLHELRVTDARSLNRATTAAAGLAPVDACLDPAVLRDRPLRSPEQQAATRELDEQLARVSALKATGTYKDGLALARAAVATARAVGVSATVSEGEYLIATLESNLGDHTAAEHSLLRALAAARDAHDQRHALTSVLQLIWVVGDRLTRFAEAKVWAEAARLEISHIPGDTRPAEAALANNLGQVLQAQGTYAEAIPLQERALELWTEVYGEGHPLVALALNNLGNACSGKGALAEAIGHHERALAIREQTLGTDHPLVAGSLSNLGLTYNRMARVDDALRVHERALAIRERVLDEDNPDLIESLNNLAVVHKSLHHNDEALRMYERALAILARAPDSNPTLRATLLFNSGRLQASEGRAIEAAARLEQAVAIFEAALGKDHLKVSYPLIALGELRSRANDHDGAARLVERALAIREKALGPEHPDVATNLAALARIERARDHLDAALRLDTRALAIYETKLGKDNVQLAEMLTGQGETHLAAQRPADAIAPLTRALALTEPRKDYRSATNHLRFLLARALWDARSDRPRALTLAATAAAESVDSDDDKARAELTAWLAAHRR